MGPDPSGMILSTTLVSTFFLILAIIVILARAQTAEMKLILIGVFLAIAAAAQSNVSALSPNAAQVALTAGLGSVTLMKIAVILTLAGVGMLFLPRVAPPATARTEAEHPHVN